jgi:hypothetical protein
MSPFHEVSRVFVVVTLLALTRCSSTDHATSTTGHNAGMTGSSTSASRTPENDAEVPTHSPTAPAGANALPAGSKAPPPSDAEPTPAADAGQTEDPPVQPGQLCDRITTLQCAAESRCCDTARASNACKAARMMDCNSTNLDDIARLPVSGFNQEKAATLLRTLERLSSSCDPSVKPWSVSPDGLRSLFEGTVAADQACTPATGIPSIPSYGAALASCKEPATHACLFTGAGLPPAPPATATCEARASAGAKCFVETNCQEDSYCDNLSMTYSGGTCIARKELGQPCVRSFECTSGFCNHTDAVCGPPDVQQAYCN